MLGKGVKLGDCLLAIAIILPMGALVGAILGFYGNRFGLSGGIRVLVIVAFAGLSGRIAQAVVMRRVRGRAAVKREEV